MENAYRDGVMGSEGGKKDLTYYVANRRQNLAVSSIYSPSVKQLTWTLAFGFIPLKNNPLNSESTDC